MKNRTLIWGASVLLYAFFFCWYTNLSGPMVEEEISFYIERFKSTGMSADKLAGIRQFMEQDTGDDFMMANVLDLRDVPRQVGDVQPGEGSEETMKRYMSFMFPALLSRACHPVIYGKAVFHALDMEGIDAGNWSAAAMFRYRSRRDLVAIASDPAFASAHQYKIAALEKTIAYPIDTMINLGDPRFFIALILLVVSLSLQLALNKPVQTR